MKVTIVIFWCKLDGIVVADPLFKACKDGGLLSLLGHHLNVKLKMMKILKFIKTPQH
jgi:hypothetical protein